MKSFLVLGLGRFGSNFAKTLHEMGHEVLAVDSDMHVVQDFADNVTHAVQAEITDEDFLVSIGVDKYDAVIVAIGSNVQVAIMATVILKDLGAKYILVKARDDFEAKILYKVGADKVILPEKDMAIKAAKNLVSSDFFDVLEISPEFSIASISVPHKWIDKSIGELAIRTRYGINIIAVKRTNGTVFSPASDTILLNGDTLTVLGDNKYLKKLKSIT